MPTGTYKRKVNNGFKKGHPFYKGGEKGWFKKGGVPHNKGKKYPDWEYKHTSEQIEKIRKSKLELYKDKTKHPNYKDGSSLDKIEYVKKWNKANPEKVKKSRQKYRKKNIERYREWNRSHRVLKMNCKGTHTFGEWELLKKQYGYSCVRCKKCEPEIKLTEDHIIPLSKGGSDYIENIQPLCGSCNSKKHTEIIKY
jgi:5-methylcytosine-specific restriction endonuclease McrA